MNEAPEGLRGAELPATERLYAAVMHAGSSSMTS